jgi:hypothetical protein
VSDHEEKMRSNKETATKIDSEQQDPQAEQGMDYPTSQ